MSKHPHNLTNVFVFNLFKMAAYKAVSLVAIVCALFGTEVKSVSRRHSRPGGPEAHYRSPVVDGGRTGTPFGDFGKWFNRSLSIKAHVCSYAKQY